MSNNGNGASSLINGGVHCFSIQVVMSKCFLLNPGKKKKNGAASSCCFREKRKKRTFNSEQRRHRAEG